MSNKLKNEIINHHITIDGGISDGMSVKQAKLDVIITNDSYGKTISIHDGERMFTIPYEPIEELLK